MSASAKTDSTDYRSRIFSCETHLIDIEVLLDGLLFLDESTTPDAETAIRAMPFIRHVHHSLVDHAAALRRELWPEDSVEKGSTS